MVEKLIPVSISGKAIEEIKNIMQNKNIPPEYGLRVGIKGGGGCGGVSFLLGFDKKKETDDSFIIHDVPVLIEKKHIMFLIGMEVDFHEGADARGFVFNKVE